MKSGKAWPESVPKYLTTHAWIKLHELRQNIIREIDAKKLPKLIQSWGTVKF